MSLEIIDVELFVNGVLTQTAQRLAFVSAGPDNSEVARSLLGQPLGRVRRSFNGQPYIYVVQYHPNQGG